MAKQRLPISIRRLVFQRAQGCCEYCKSPSDFATQSFAIEHIIPTAIGGSNDSDNLALACQAVTRTNPPKPKRPTRSRSNLSRFSIPGNMLGAIISIGTIPSPKLSA